MLKVTLLASVLAAMAMGTNISITGAPTTKKALDTKVILEVNRDLETLTEEGVENTHRAVINNLRSKLGNDFKIVSEYSHVANAIAISINSEDIELVKQLPGVASVTKNELHWKDYQTQSITTSSDGESGEYGSSENISATTMKKPEDTNDGEGTVIAILDNEFYLKGKTDDTEAGAAWSHETFTAFSTHEAYGTRVPDVAVHFKGSVIKEFTTVHGAKNAGSSSRPEDMGKEGSCYFNNKVPYYYDYGGETTSHAEDYNEDFDVTSKISYHGSHVASIAAGNADTYKGIAPKAQLVCMKVFTNYKASATDKLLGYQNSSGAYDIPILNALEDCLIMKVDGINMSLGSNLDDFDAESITNKTLTKLCEKGILTAISAGNAGKDSFNNTGGYSNWTKNQIETGIMGGYANVESVMTIAAGQPEKLFYSAAFKMRNTNTTVAFEDQITNRDYSDIEYTTEYKMTDLGSEFEWVYVPGFGRPSDYVNLNVTGKVAVVNRGNTSFADKYNEAHDQGAKAIIIINNDPTANDFNFRCSFGDGFRPMMPCAMVLFKDKTYFETDGSGIINIVEKQTHENPNAYQMSFFSSDGATYDLDLKPEITTPGENIRGAIPPQKKEDQGDDRRLKVYEYLSGTSMSAPNYAGAQSVVLSKFAKGIYEKFQDPEVPVPSSQVKKVEEFRKTVDMRLMSTSDPMTDGISNGETEAVSISSPRRQGAGMANLGKALATDVYLEGYNYHSEANGQTVGTLNRKSKITLRNTAEINKGQIKFDFIAHNENTVDHTYNMSLSVMRPAIVKTQDIVTGQYNDLGEIDSIKTWPGYTYYVNIGIGQEIVPEARKATGTAEHNDVYKASKDIEYFASAEDLLHNRPTVISKGRYYNAGTLQEPRWEPLPTEEFVSVRDVEIEKGDLGSITVAKATTKGTAVDTVISVDYTISQQAKTEIAKLFEYGCFLEGYLTLKATDGGVDLGMPYMGYYSINHEAGEDYTTMPVVEPFSFEKNTTTVYPSQMVNDYAKQLVGKDKADFGSIMVTGYVKPGVGFDEGDVLNNDANFRELNQFTELGVDPSTGKFYQDAADNLYCGNQEYSNTLIIQQFVLRSVDNNYFTITNKETGEEVYRSALEDMFFGERYGKYALYKSLVDNNYASAGYIGHRAYAEVPLYDFDTGKPFDSGKYELKFNYLLAGTKSWVSKAYTLNIDSTAPEVRAVIDNGSSLTFRIFEDNLSKVSVGKYNKDFVVNNDGTATVTVSKSEISEMLNDGFNRQFQSSRLFVGLTDKALGRMGVLIRFDESGRDINYTDYTLVEHHSLTMMNDFADLGDKKFQLYEYNSSTGKNTAISVEGFVIFSNGMVPYIHDEVIVTKGCGGNIVTTSILVSSIALAAALTIIIAKAKKKKTEGGK